MASVDERVSVRIFSDELSCCELSQLLQLEPVRCHEKGEPVAKNASELRQESLWIYAPELDGALENQIEHIVNIFIEKKDSLVLVQNKISIEFLCGVSSENGQGNIFLGKALLGRLFDLGADLSIEYYLY